MSQLTINSSYPMPSGHKIPILGFGVYQTPAAECESIVSQALKHGYRHVDSAQAYRNEAPSAAALLNSGLPREELFFTTKIRPGQLGYDLAAKSIDKSIQDTGLGYLDLVLIHAPYGGKEARNGTWLALREAQKAGKIRSIGVSNYGLHHLDELEAYIKSLDAEQGAGAGGRIDVGQWELHPWLMRKDIVDWCRKRDVVIQSWGPLVRATRWGDKKVVQLADKYGKTEAQVLVRWSLQRGFVPLPKSVSAKRIEENASVFGWELDEEDAAALDHPELYEPCAWDPTTSED